MSRESQGIALLAASVVRPFALVAAAWVMLRLLRVRHPASRHSVWTGVLIGMLVLPFVSVFAPHWMVPVLPAKRAVVAQDIFPISAPVEFTDLQNTSAPKPALPSVGTVIVWIYLAGLFAMVAYRAVGWALLWRVMLRSRLVRGRLRESGDIVTPVAIGVLRPVVILPGSWREWDADMRRRVLAHEFAHLRRHDALVSGLAWWVKCLFWFHPLAWLVSRKVSELAELACDAAALEKLGDPAGYSRMLLGFADAVRRAGWRVALPGMAMAAGSGMDRRIGLVFELSDGKMRKLARPGVLLALAGLPVLCLASTVGLGEPGGPLPRPSAAPLPSPVRSSLAAFGTPPAKPPLVVAQQSVTPEIPASSVSTLKFDAASIKLSKDCGGGPGRVGGTDRSSPGRLRLNCFSVQRLIGLAYGSGAVNNRPPTGIPIEGGPSWVDSDLYAIEAEAGGSPDRRTMRGPMLQALLEDRLQLKIHRETREIPVYALTVAKGGSRLQPFREGSCIPIVPGEPRPAPGEKPFCGLIGMRRGRSGPNITWEAVGVKFADFSQYFGFILDRPLIDSTGITGVFDFHLEFAPDETTAHVANPFGPDSSGQAGPSDPAGGLSIFTAFQQQLGLKLESAKGPGEFLVIDHVERPSEN